MSPKVGASSDAPVVLTAGGAAPMEVTRQFQDPTVIERALIAHQSSQGTDLGANAASSSIALNPQNESVAEFLTPKKAQMRMEIEQIHRDMQWNVYEAQAFVKEHELHNDAKTEAVLRAQQQRFETTARHWEQESHDHTKKEVADAAIKIEQHASDVFQELNA